MNALPRVAAAAVICLVAAACGGESVLGSEGTGGTSSTVTAPPAGNPGASSTSEPGASSTSAPGASSTSPSTTMDSVDDPSVMEILSLAPLPDDLPEVAPGEELGGAPNRTAAAALTAEMEAAGYDLIGVAIWVWPLAGSDETLLLMELDDAAAGLAEGPAADAMLMAVFGSPILETAGVTRVVFTYHSTDDEGPFTFTATYPFDAVLTAMREGTDVPEEVIGLQLERG